MSNLWQHPYVNVFKHFDVQSWKKSTKEGEVTSMMDKTLKSTIYKIMGSIPAGNYIQLPKTTTQSLGLTGRYLYLIFKPIPGKYFVVHVDVTTQDGLVVRISFSNLFKEFKSTSTWLQFPFLCHASKGSISGKNDSSTKDQNGPAPITSRWTLLCLDFQYILSMYLNRRYSYVKSIKLCANMLVKNIFTSDMEYEPGVTLRDAKRLGVNLKGMAPMPREMSMMVSKGQSWHDYYDHIRFPSNAAKQPYDSLDPKASAGPPGSITPKKVVAKVVKSKGRSFDDEALPTNKKHGKKTVTSVLPSVNVTADGDVSIEQRDDGEVHIYANPTDEVVVHQENKVTGEVSSQKVKAPAVVLSKKDNYTSLQPDPILQLRRIVGFGGVSSTEAIWTENATTVVYPCHAVVIAMQTSNGHQRFFIGHTDKISCISMNGNSSLLASGQTGSQSVVRVWRFSSGECLAMFKTHVHSLSFLSFSQSGNVLCGVGRDGHSKNMLVIWNTEQCHKNGAVSIIAKAHTDVDIARFRISAFDETRMVSCGRDNIRLWRVKDGSLRSAPVNLGEYHSMEFTDCCFQAGYDATKDPMDRLVYASTKSGHIFEVDYRRVAIHSVKRLLPVNKSDNKKEKQTFSSGSGVCINSLSVNEAFCVTGSDDGFLRLWPLDFKHVYLEAEHEGPVTAVDISSDGIKILAGTSTGNLGILDVSTRGYTTIMRSHTSRILAMSLDPLRRHLATVSEDHTIRIWDLDTMQQLYDFSAPREIPCTVVYHPSDQIFSCGFESGAVRVFNVSSTSMLAEHKQHRGKVIGLVYSPSGEFMYSAGSLGSLALYDASDTRYNLMRLLPNTLARGQERGPLALTISPDGKCLAFVGPTEFTVSVVESRSLDELLRIDITSISPVDGGQSVVDSAMRVHYASRNTGHLLVTTTSNKLLKFDAKRGRILDEMSNIHRSGCTSLDASVDGRHLFTAGDKVIKVWDYNMRLDLNFQVFIGHSEKVSGVLLTPDQLSVITCGEALFIWDFLAKASPTKQELVGREHVHNFFTGEDEEPNPYKSLPIPVSGDSPRKEIPIPTKLDDFRMKIDYRENHIASSKDSDDSSTNSETEEVLIGPELRELTIEDSDSESTEQVITVEIGAGDLGDSPSIKKHQRQKIPKKQVALEPSILVKKTADEDMSLVQPVIFKPFNQRKKKGMLAQRRYTAPPNQAGIKLASVIGYNGNGRNNLVWQPDTGVFAYSSGCIVVVEDLNEGTQQHLPGHAEEISTMALQNDSQVLASASGPCGMSGSQICLWDLRTLVCKKVLNYHETDIVCLAYSRDDRFLVSVGDYKENTIVVWCSQSYAVLTTAKSKLPVYDLKWDPFTVNEFSSVGANASMSFWLLDETGPGYSLNVHEAKAPEDLLAGNKKDPSQTDFTCLEYAGDSTVYVGSSNGTVSAWDTRHNTCFIHWEADNHEIGILYSRCGKLITGSTGRSLRLWSVKGIGEMRHPGDGNLMRQGGLTMEDEMDLDAEFSCGAFDETLDMGIVGTAEGTLWYINWAERASIRLVSGHMKQVNSLAVHENQFLASCSNDGSLRVWSIKDREQTLQFQVMEQSCNCLAFSPLPKPETSTISTQGETTVVSHSPRPKPTTKLPNVVAGYSDGTVRMFDLNKVEMVLKMHPHAVAVTAISFSSDGRMILSGGCDGLIAISSPTTGMTVRVINDHRGAPITCIDVSFARPDVDYGVSAPLLWLAASADRRVSVWSADWSKDFCELIDWLTFPAPGFTPDGTIIKKGDQSYYQQLPPTLAKFSFEESDIIVYAGYGAQKNIQFYSISQRKVIRSIPLTHWAISLDLSPTSPIIAVGVEERLLKLIDYYEGSFQDFVGHNDGVQITKFSADGKSLLTSAYSELFSWDVCV